MKILFVTPEAAPFAKTGGLADVAGSLPQELARLGHEVAVILPCYRSLRERFAVDAAGSPVDVPVAGSPRSAGLLRTRLGGVTVYLVDRPAYFDRPELYGTAAGDYPDNAERFGFFCRAVLRFLPQLDVCPEVLHLNDWQTGLIPVLLRTELKNDPVLGRLGTLLTIHNLGYQGIFPASVLADLGLNRRLYSIDGLEYYDRISFLKGGILFADLVNTVSETYCREIQTPDYGHGFDGILRRRRDDLYGVLNGIDPRLWDPAADPTLVSPFSAADLRGKARCRRELRRELALAPDAAGPVVAMVTRLDTQKGLDLVEEAWPELMRRELQFVLLGTGEERHMKLFRGLRGARPGQVSINLTFDDALSRRIYAGSDLFLMPSRYEPCGLGQLIALRYGAVPLVRRTGGLADTVTDPEVDPRQANGFTFGAATAPALLGGLDRALEHFGRRRSWLELMRRGMTRDFSWTRSAQRYLELYRLAAERRHG